MKHRQYHPAFIWLIVAIAALILNLIEGIVIIRLLNRGETMELPEVISTPTETQPVKKESELEAFAREHGLKISQWPRSLLELMDRNPDAAQFVLEYPLKKDQEVTSALDAEITQDQVPLLFQWDQRWGYTRYGDDVLGITGCGPTCLSMVSAWLLQDPGLTPDAIARFSQDHGFCVPGNGSAWSLIPEGGRMLGLDVIEIPLDRNRILSNLEVGNPIVCVMGPGDFTTSGHFVVLVSAHHDMIQVHDPNSRVNSGKLWPLERLEPQIRNLWVCRKPG